MQTKKPDNGSNKASESGAQYVPQEKKYKVGQVCDPVYKQQEALI